MTSKIKVDNINKVSDDSNIINKCGTTITLGASGDSINLASGATQTGFGRTGTVDWNTTPVTATPTTATSGTGYFINSTGGAKTLNLPASPSAGDIVSVKDYAGTASTYAITIGRNGSLIRSGTNDFAIEKANGGATFIYVDGIEGWQVFVDGSDADVQASYICASVSGSCNAISVAPDCANYKIAVFKNPGTLTVNSVSDKPAFNDVDWLVVGGGGGGGAGCGAGAGGGGGGFRFSGNPSSNPQTGPGSPRNSCSAVTVVESGYPITVGGGGTGGPFAGGPGPAADGTKGVDSVFSGKTSTGGGFGGAGRNPSGSGGPGGSGGGEARDRGSQGTGNDPSTSPPQGEPGGPPMGNTLAGTGGGGAMAAGGSGGCLPATSGGYGGVGGAGAGITGFGTTGQSCGGQYYYSGGGGGGTFNCATDTPGGPGTESNGGIGGGGPGAMSPLHPGSYSGPASPANKQWGVEGTDFTGGGGGGGGESPTAGTPTNDGSGGNGGSGIVVIRYRFQ